MCSRLTPEPIHSRPSNIFGAVLSSIAILTVNRPPIANPQSVSGDEDTAIAVTLSGSDPDGDSLSYHMTAPSHGVLEGVVPSLVYHPFTNYNGPDSFTGSTLMVIVTTADSSRPSFTLNVKLSGPL